ncbi:MAG TPA: tetratricopeptide repeat protein [Chloroflexota bacterium]|nr:tetratricopeptide repeat protein [Chloroflexota bacterium]
MTRSLQDIIKRRQQYDFVGRERQVGSFRENLGLSLDDERRRFVYSIHGPGGVGKTWLVRRLHSLAQQAGMITAWTDDAEGDVLGVMEQIAGRIEAQGRSMTDFSDRLREFRRSSGAAQSRRGVDRVTSDDPAGRGTRATLTLLRAPIEPSPTGFASDVFRTVNDVSTASLPATGPIGAEGSFPSLDPVRVLTSLFVSALGVGAEDRPVALFFDTYERTSRFLDDWLRALLEGSYGDLPASTIICIAGQVALDSSRWGSFESVIAWVPLEAFSEDEARLFLARKGVTDERVVSGILRVSGRLPVLVATMALGRGDHAEPIVDESDDAIGYFMRSLDDSSRRSILLDASLPRHLDADLLAHVIGRVEVGALVDWLRTMPFVEQRAGAWIYRQVVRDSLLRQYRHDSAQRWSELHGHLAGYYERLAAGLNLDETSRWQNPTWQAAALEALYHRLCQSPPDSLLAALGGFVPAFGGQREFARRWAETIEQAGKDTDDAELRDWGGRLLAALQAYSHGQYEAAAATFNRLLETAALDERSRPEALVWHGRLLFAAGHLERALRTYTSLLQLVPGAAPYWIERGVALARLGYHREAVDDFSRALEILPTSVEALANRGEAYRLLEAYDEALADFDRVLAADSNNAEILGRRGQVLLALERYDDALIDLSRAVELAPEEAWIRAERGSAYRCLARFDEAIGDLGQALRVDPGNVWALAVRGDVYWQLKRYDAARADFNRALGVQQQSA